MVWQKPISAHNRGKQGKWSESGMKGEGIAGNLAACVNKHFKLHFKLCPHNGSKYCIMMPN